MLTYGSDLQCPQSQPCVESKRDKFCNFHIYFIILIYLFFSHQFWRGGVQDKCRRSRGATGCHQLPPAARGCCQDHPRAGSAPKGSRPQGIYLLAPTQSRAGSELRCFHQLNADDPRAVGPKDETRIPAFHFHMVFMGPPCRNQRKSLIQKPPGLADLLPN